MKLMRKNWKDRKGVSPVIATILMVAITVVLAAVLYVMVMGFGGESGSVPTGEFKAAEKVGADYRVQVLSISEAKDVADMKFSISTSAGTDVFGFAVAQDGKISTTGDATLGASVTFVDLNGDKKVSSGDYFTVTIPTPGIDKDAVAYTVALSYSPSSGTGGVVCDTTFTGPAGAVSTS